MFQVEYLCTHPYIIRACLHMWMVQKDEKKLECGNDRHFTHPVVTSCQHNGARTLHLSHFWSKRGHQSVISAEDGATSISHKKGERFDT